MLTGVVIILTIILFWILIYICINGVVNFSKYLSPFERTKTTEGFSSTIMYDVIRKTEDMTEPPFGYVVGSGINEGKFVSVFPLEEIPSSGVKYGYERVTTSAGDKMVPITEDAIYTAVETANTALLGSDMMTIPIIVHREKTTTKNIVGIDDVRSIIRQVELAFFNNSAPGKKNLFINWKVEEGTDFVDNTDDASKKTDTDTYNNYLLTRNPIDKLSMYGKTPHLFILDKNEKIDGGGAAFSYLSETLENPSFVVFQGNSLNQGRISNIDEKPFIQELCKLLGLRSDEGLDVLNVMGSSTSGLDIDMSQQITLKQQGSLLAIKKEDSSQVNMSEETKDLIDKVEETQKDYKDNYYDTVQYRDSEEEIRAQMKEEGTGLAYVIDKDGNRVALGKASTQPNQLYHTVGSYPFGSANYVPKYDDAVYLSKLTGETTATTLEDTADMKGGFCKQEANFPLKIDEKCRALDKNNCASTSCCVLLGGAKCVAGNVEGPTLSKYYSDSTIVNRDYYYYQGKCYGHCPERDPL